MLCWAKADRNKNKAGSTNATLRTTTIAENREKQGNRIIKNTKY
jgi:hypothetical protein